MQARELADARREAADLVVVEAERGQARERAHGVGQLGEQIVVERELRRGAGRLPVER